MPIPAEVYARRDPALRGIPIAVYDYLKDVLHPVDFRDVPQLSVACFLGISDRHLRRALNTLTERGYLEREPVRGSYTRRYRLVYEPRKAVDSRHPAA